MCRTVRIHLIRLRELRATSPITFELGIRSARAVVSRPTRAPRLLEARALVSADRTSNVGCVGCVSCVSCKVAIGFPEREGPTRSCGKTVEGEVAEESYWALEVVEWRDST